MTINPTQRPIPIRRASRPLRLGAPVVVAAVAAVGRPRARRMSGPCPRRCADVDADGSGPGGRCASASGCGDPSMSSAHC